jgi:RimJ/RimL family protein N-acetyltransferase
VTLALPWDFTEYRTDRLLVRRMRLDDVDDVHDFLRREDVAQYELHEPQTYEQVVEKVARCVEHTRLEADGDWVQPAIELDGRVVGQLYLKLDSVTNATVEVGWTVHPEVQGRGYATEAAAPLVDRMFGEAGFHRVKAEVDPENAPSIALCRRLGMREEALFVKDLWLKGAWVDTGIYAMLEDEWSARREDASAS